MVSLDHPNRIEGLVIAESIRRIRRNHALEHSTVSLLLEWGVTPPLGGYSTPGGFFLFGRVPTETAVQAAHEALKLLRDGKRERAISPHCGTNILAGAVMAGLASAMILGSRGEWLRRLPAAVAAATVATIASRPVGNAIQRRYTTMADMTGVEIREITPLWARPGDRFTLHSVHTTFDSVP